MHKLDANTVPFYTSAFLSESVKEPMPHRYQGTTLVLFRTGLDAKYIKVNAPNLTVVQTHGLQGP